MTKGFNASAGHLALFLAALAALVACGGSDSEKAAAHYFAGTELAAAGEWQKAIAEFDESIRLNLDVAEPYATRGAV